MLNIVIRLGLVPRRVFNVVAGGWGPPNMSSISFVWDWCPNIHVRTLSKIGGGRACLTTVVHMGGSRPCPVLNVVVRSCPVPRRVFNVVAWDWGLPLACIQCRLCAPSRPCGCRVNFLELTSKHACNFVRLGLMPLLVCLFCSCPWGGVPCGSPPAGFELG